MSLQLFVNPDHENDLVYLINNKYYDATTLFSYEKITDNLIQLLEWNESDLQNISFQPLYISLEGHNKWMIFDISDNEDLKVIAEGENIDEEEIITNATILSIPELSKKEFPLNIYEKFVHMINNRMKLNQYEPPNNTPLTIHRSYESALSEPGSPEYDRSTMSIENEDLNETNRHSEDDMNESGRLRQSGLRMGSMERDAITRLSISDLMERVERNDVESNNPTNRVEETPSEDPLLKESFDMLMRQIYNLPIELPSFLIIEGQQIPFINFSQAGKLLSSGQINKYTLEPILQPWAGHPFLNNRIITLFDVNGNKYLVKASYNAKTGQIFAPE
jgi:hypothetical protein